LRSGVKGQDYDIEIALAQGRTVNCEVKSKSEQTDLNSETIKGALEVSRKQLPKGEPGITFMKIPEDWVKKREIVEVVGEALNAFFRRTNRVVAVVFRWEEWYFVRGGSATVAYRFRVERNLTSELLVPEVDRLLEKISDPLGANWTAFRAIAGLA
jgi:hypothetical protein